MIARLPRSMTLESSASCPSFLRVDVVLRAHPRVHALDHVVHYLQLLLDVSAVLSVAVAAQHQPLGSQSLTLLEHAARREQIKGRHWSSDVTRRYRQFQVESALESAAARGFFAGVRWLRAEYHPTGKFQGSAERAALYSGNLAMLHYLYRDFSEKMVEDAVVECQDAVAHAAATGRLDVVRWVCHVKGPAAFGWSVMDAALAQNQMHVVHFLDRIVGNRCTRRGLEQAARNGHLDVVTWLHRSRYYEIRTFRTLENAIAGGHLPVVQYVMEMVVMASTSWMQAALTAAVKYGQGEILQWLHERASVEAAVSNQRFRFDMCTKQLYTVARAGHLDVLQWLHANNYSVHCRRAHAVRGAATGGHRAIIEWMEHTFESLSHQRHRIRADGAASLGDLQFMMWLHHQGYRFTSRAMDDAAAGGYVDIVRWMHENVERVQCTVAAMDRAAANGHLDIVEFLHQNRKEGCTTAAMDNAARNGHYRVVKFLFMNRSEYCTALAGESRSVQVLQFLKENNRLRSLLPKTVEVATRGDLELLQWLYNHDRRRFEFEAVIGEAREHNHFKLLCWLETLPEAGKYC